jgi:hypothetical protein
MEPCFYSVVFGWSRVVIVWKVFVLLGCLFSGPLARDKRLFLELFLSVPGFSGLLVFYYPI